MHSCKLLVAYMCDLAFMMIQTDRNRIVNYLANYKAFEECCTDSYNVDDTAILLRICRLIMLGVTITLDM